MNGLRGLIHRDYGQIRGEMRKLSHWRACYRPNPCETPPSKAIGGSKCFTAFGDADDVVEVPSSFA